MVARRVGTSSGRLLAGLAIALVGGLAIGYVDSRPGWDDTGITAVSLLLVGGVGAAVARRVPWAVALLGGAWLPLFERSSVGSGVALAAFVLTGAGAAIGWLVARR